MKSISLISGALLLVVGGFTVFNGSSPKIEKEIALGLETGDVEKIASFFAPDVEFSSFNIDDFISKAEAKEQLAQFFDQNPPAKYTPKHDGESKGQTSKYLIGELETETGIFRVNIFLKYSLIEQISFTKEKESQLNF